MALGSTQPLREMSSRSVSLGKGGRCVWLTTLPPSCAVVMKSGYLNFLEPSGQIQTCNGTALPLPCHGNFTQMINVKYLSFLTQFNKTSRQGYGVVQLVEALRYKPEGRRIDSLWCHWNFSVDMALGLTQPLT